MASKTIKGLTVEIGGDTTKLSKALKDVEAKSRSLSKELGDINKLLKLDPGNADLLAQKQKVLAEAAEATAQKLKTLKEAERQVQAQFERGEVSEEQLRALQREIVATENKMKGYQKAAQQTAQEIEQLGDGSDKAGKDVKETGNEAKKSAQGLDTFGDSAEKAERSSDGLGKTLGTAVKTGLAAVGAVCAAAVTGLVAAAEGTREYRTEMGKLNTAFTQNEFTAEAANAAYTDLVGIIGETDQAVEAANHLAKLTDNEKDLAKWTGTILPGVFSTFGDSLQPEALTEAANETARVGQVCGPMADALNWAAKEGETFGITMKANTKANEDWNKAVENATSAEDFFNLALQECSTEQDRQALITETLAGYYGEAAAAYKETNAEVIRANQANDQWMQSLAGVGGAIEPIVTDVKMMGASLLANAVPGVQKLAEAFRGLMSGDAGASGGFAAALSGLVTGLADKINQALPTIAQTGLSIISTLGTSLLQQAPTLLSTGGQIISQLLTGLSTSLPTMAQGALTALGGFVSSLQTNLPLVLAKGREILLNLTTGIKQNLPGLISQGLDILMNFAQTIYDNAPTLIQTGFDALSNLVSGIMSALPTIIAKAPEIISKFANTLNDNVPMILSKGVQLVVQIVKGIISAIPTLIQNAGKVIQAFVDVWQAFNWVNLGKKAITLLKNGITNMGGTIKGAGTKIMTTITNALKALPGKLRTLGKNAINFLKNAIVSARTSVAAAGGNILTAVVNAITSLPSKLLTLGKNAISRLASAISSGAGTVRSKALSLVSSVVAAVKTLPGKVLSVGKDMVKGIWEGISGATSWIKSKISDWVGDVTSFLKNLFGIESPSKLMRDEIGQHLPTGIAAGVEKTASAATGAMAALSQDMLTAADPDVGGLSFERNLSSRPARIGSAYGATAAAFGADNAALLAKLDGIYERLGRLQVVLDSGATVGGLIDKIDAGLATRQALHARGG